MSMNYTDTGRGRRGTCAERQSVAETRSMVQEFRRRRTNLWLWVWSDSSSLEKMAEKGAEVQVPYLANAGAATVAEYLG